MSNTALRRRVETIAVNSPMAWGIDSEVGRLREVVLCAPDHWAFVGEANAIARAAAAEGMTFDRGVAKQQHRNLVSAFEDEGVVVRWLPQLTSQKAQTYTRDSSFMTPWGVVVSLMQAECRRGEYAAIIDFCRSSHIPIWNMVTDGPLEGGDVHVAKPGKVLIGYSQARTTKKGASQVLSWFANEGWHGKLIYIDPHFLHLDLLFCMVDIETAIICTDVLAPSKVDEIVNFLEISNVVGSTYRQAMKLLGNVVALGNRKVIIHKDPQNSDLIRQLHRLGFTALEVDVSSFAFDGGGPHCLAMPYRRDPYGAEAQKSGQLR
jgi:arginine deiminase